MADQGYGSKCYKNGRDIAFRVYSYVKQEAEAGQPVYDVTKVQQCSAENYSNVGTRIVGRTVRASHL
jgi:hypothetical protein